MDKGQIIGLLSLADIVDYKSTLSSLCIENLITDPTAYINTISDESNPNDNSNKTAYNSPSIGPEKVDYSIPENRWKYIQTLIQGKCEPGSKAEKLLNDLFKKYTSVVKCPNEKLGFTQAIKHEIPYEWPQTIFIPPYKCAAAEEKEVNAEVIRILEADLIEVS